MTVFSGRQSQARRWVVSESSITIPGSSHIENSKDEGEAMEHFLCLSYN